MILHTASNQHATRSRLKSFRPLSGIMILHFCESMSLKMDITWDSFPSPVGDYDSSLCIVGRLYLLCVNARFRPLSGIMILHLLGKFSSKCASLGEQFPSPVGDYDSSLAQQCQEEGYPSHGRFPSPVGDYDSSLIWARLTKRKR